MQPKFGHGGELHAVKRSYDMTPFGQLLTLPAALLTLLAALLLLVVLLLVVLRQLGCCSLFHHQCLRR